MRKLIDLDSLTEALIETEMPVITEGLYKDVSQTEEFKTWYAGSKLVDGEGNPLRLYRGLHPNGPNDTTRIPENAAKGLPHLKNVTFCTSNPEGASQYGQAPGGGVSALYVKADKLIEYQSREPHFRWQSFDSEAMGLKPGEVLVARGVDDFPGRKVKGDIYAFNYGTQVTPALGSKSRVDNHHLKDLQPEAYAKMKADLIRWKAFKQSIGYSQLYDRMGDALTDKLFEAVYGIALEAEYMARAKDEDFWKAKYGFDPETDLTMFIAKSPLRSLEFTGFDFLKKAYTESTEPEKEQAWEILQENLSHA